MLLTSGPPNRTFSRLCKAGLIHGCGPFVFRNLSVTCLHTSRDYANFASFTHVLIAFSPSHLPLPLPTSPVLSPSSSEMITSQVMQLVAFRVARISTTSGPSFTSARRLCPRANRAI